jgi:2-iminobutanoate/2-iminopropanoate deaminase
VRSSNGPLNQRDRSLDPEVHVQKEIISPPTLPDAAQYGYSQGVRAGNLLFLGGQGGQNREGQVPEPGDFEAQVRRTFANMQAVLEAAGGTLSNIVTMTTFLVDMRHAPEFARLRREILGSDFPADALIGVSQLWDPALMLEIQAIAVLD